jgi:EAL domain-containing protein (putative c-di-GMP-specific phosphodiesterase class I)
VDDFGTGYSSLNYLKKLPIHQLKIDKSFIKDINSDHGDAAIVSTVVSLAHNFNLKVIAEGVENVEQLNTLQLMDCDEAQGYYFHKPMSTSDFNHLSAQLQ